jgi:hypothetical protein
MWSELDLRSALFGDVPVDNFPPASSAMDLGEPWASFVHAKNALRAGETAGAISTWRRIADTPGLESRYYAQAWFFLRGQGVTPPAEIANRLLGVVVEVEMGGGAMDLLAAYADHTARYYNYRGAGVVWEHPTPALDGHIDALLNNSQRVVQMTAPREGERPATLASGEARLNFITPGGMHFGQGLLKELSADAAAKPVIDTATALMQKLIATGAKTPK